MLAQPELTQSTLFKMAEEGRHFQEKIAKNTIEKLMEIEELGEEILTEKHQLVDLDKKRNANREALRAIKKHDKDEKSWLCVGNMFFKMDDDKIEDVLQHDQKQLDEEIDKIRNGLKPKVRKLHELEGLPDVKGYELAGLSSEELEKVRGNIGR